MSWLIGYSGDLDYSRRKKISSLASNSEFTISNENIFIAAGGNKNTFRYSENSKFIVLGFGISDSGDRYKWMNQNNWESVVENNLLNAVEGHYLFLSWNNNQIDFISDPVGMRTIYFFKTPTAYIFSTKIDWLSELSSGIKIDFYEFGAKWLLHNKMSFNYFLSEIKKLPPNSIAKLTGEKLEIKANGSIATTVIEDKDDLIDNLIKLLRIKIPSDFRITLGLSGGLDSRFLLSLILKENLDVSLHTFGYEDEPDIIIAKKISENLKLNFRYLESTKIFDQNFFNQTSYYLVNNDLVEPVSTFLKLQTFNDDYFKDKVIIDGALAEFARRQLHNKLIYFGKKHLITKNPQGIFPYIASSKPKFFKQEYLNQMYNGAINEIRNIFNELPEIKEIGAEAFADLLVYKFKIPISIGAEQARLDQILVSFMPFAQKRIFELTQRIPLEKRNNSRLFYDTISEFSPQLEKFPLVKNNLIYPYSSSTIKAQLIRKFKQIFSSRYDNNKVFMLHSIKDYVVETLSVESLKNYHPYDLKIAEKILRDFYNGRNELADDLDWLLSFEIFRKRLEIIE